LAKIDSNIADGRYSYDIEVNGLVVPFFNKNITPYATESNGPKFDLVPVEKQKDIMLNVARMHAQQEYDRIVELVKVLQTQADGIRRRLELTDMVHGAKYDFQVYHGQRYWLVYDTANQFNRLVKISPTDWACGIPEGYEYLAEVKWLGDHTWIEIDEKGNYVT
jgi:hypothetical protein